MKICSLKHSGIFLCLFLLVNCSNNEIKETQHSVKKNYKQNDFVTIISPIKYSPFVINDSIEVHLTFDESVEMDSVVCNINNEKIALKNISKGSVKDKIIIPVKKTGRNIIRFTSFLNENIQETDYTEITTLSDIEPEHYSYKIINTFNHQISAFTQGLVYENGLIYEGTGNWGKSKLMKYNPGSSKILKEINLSPSLFGEGVEVFDDMLVQITWKSQNGFIYNKESFELIREIRFPYAEGWGITYDGKEFIMSDGSNKLYFLDKQFFTETNRIEVYDNKGPVNRINELEYVDGLIYANVLSQDYIVCIDPETGKVLKKIDLSGILPLNDRHKDIDVLNGIAYNPEKGSFYVTGKNWPKMFEVNFIKR